MGKSVTISEVLRQSVRVLALPLLAAACDAAVTRVNVWVSVDLKTFAGYCQIQNVRAHEVSTSTLVAKSLGSRVPYRRFVPGELKGSVGQPMPYLLVKLIEEGAGNAFSKGASFMQLTLTRTGQAVSHKRSQIPATLRLPCDPAEFAEAVWKLIDQQTPALQVNFKNIPLGQPVQSADGWPRERHGVLSLPWQEFKSLGDSEFSLDFIAERGKAASNPRLKVISRGENLCMEYRESDQTFQGLLVTHQKNGVNGKELHQDELANMTAGDFYLENYILPTRSAMDCDKVVGRHRMP